MVDYTCIGVVMVMVLVRNSDQVPVRMIPENEIIATESPVLTYEADPLENIGVELTDGQLIEGDIRLLHHNSAPEPSGEKMNPLRAATLAHAPLKRTNSHQARNSVTSGDSWTDRIIPYVIDTTFNSTEMMKILTAMLNITASVQNCIEFVPRQNQEDFIYITGQQSGCWSDVGKKGGNQTVSISRRSGCVTEGIIMHELMHSLGFWHEHNRPDRDTFIKIIKGNIRIDHYSDFRINPNGKMLVSTYDYYSIMHYKTNQFSKIQSSLKTISILQPGIDESKVGQRDGLSKYDVQRIMLLYNCQKYQRSVDTEPKFDTKSWKERIPSTGVPTEKRHSVEIVVDTKTPTAVTTYQTKRFDSGTGQNETITERLTNSPSETDVGRK